MLKKMMAIKRKTFGFAAVVTALFLYGNFGSPHLEAQAQSAVDPYVLYERLNRLEEQIFELRNGGANSQARRLQPKKFDGDATSAASLSLRISNMEDQMRSLNGKIEETSFLIRQLTDKFTRFSEDVEFRFQNLKTSSKSRGKKRVKKNIQKQLKTKTLGTISASSTGSQSASLAKALGSTGSARGDYNRAFSMMKKRKYAQAEVEFKSFLSHYPKNALRGNAQYWLGETYFARKQYKKSADAFLRGYTRNRTSAKAPDSLLKLGITLARLGQKEAACSAFSEMRVEFPRAPRTTRDRVQAEQRRVGC